MVMSEIVDKELLAFVVGWLLGLIMAKIYWYFKNKINDSPEQWMKGLQVDIKEIKKEIKK